jgi:hypothetical protein
LSSTVREWNDRLDPDIRPVAAIDLHGCGVDLVAGNEKVIGADGNVCEIGLHGAVNDDGGSSYGHEGGRRADHGWIRPAHRRPIGVRPRGVVDDLRCRRPQGAVLGGLVDHAAHDGALVLVVLRFT